VRQGGRWAVIGILGIAACGESPVTPGPAAAATLTITAGGNQTQVAGYPLADTVVVLLRDGDGEPIPFAPIEATTDVVLGTVTVVDALTRPDGTARLVWRLGIQLDAQRLVVRSSAVSPAVAVSLTATATSHRYAAIAGGDALLCAVDLQGRLGCILPTRDADAPPAWRPVAGGPYTTLALNHLTNGTWTGCAASLAGPVHCFDVDVEGAITNRRDLGGQHPPLVALSTSSGQHDANPPFCGLAADGSAWCWGDNRRGVLADGTIDSRQSVAAAAIPLRFARIDVGAEHACGVDAAGVGWCWGRNDLSQLGAPPNILPMPQPLRRTGLLRYHAVVPIRDGGSCGFARDNGGIWCWGEKTSLGIGQLVMGLIDGPSVAIPVYVEGLLTPAAIGVVDRTTVALTANGRHAWWGRLEPGVALVEAFAPQPFLHWVPMTSLAMGTAEGAVCGTPPGRSEVLCVRLLTATGYGTHQPVPAFAGFGLPVP
jgi:hypothetical protein